MSKKSKMCLDPSQTKRFAHDAYMAGKHGLDYDGLCPTVVDHVKESTTDEERIGKYSKKRKVDDVDRMIRHVGKKAINKVKSKWGALGDLF